MREPRSLERERGSLPFGFSASVGQETCTSLCLAGSGGSRPTWRPEGQGVIARGGMPVLGAKAWNRTKYLQFIGLMLYQVSYFCLWACLGGRSKRENGGEVSRGTERVTVVYGSLFRCRPKTLLKARSSEALVRSMLWLTPPWNCSVSLSGTTSSGKSHLGTSGRSSSCHCPGSP